MLSVLALTSVVASLCVAQTTPPTEPAKCCLDRQFTMSIGEVGGSVYPLTGNTVFLDGYTLLAYDFYKKRIGAETHRRQPDGTDKVTRSLLDYNTMRQYVDENGVCSIVNITEPLDDRCVPANATYMGPSTFGYGVESLEVNTWEYERVSANSRVLVKRSFTKTGCVPVVEALYGTVNGVQTDVAHFFVGFKPGLDDPSVLEPPSAIAQAYCKDLTGQDGAADIVG